MANEATVPLLPCTSIDEMVPFYEVLGFRRTYRQTRPNPYVAVRREDWELHFFGMDGFEPADSYGSCIVQVPDVGVVHQAFVSGMRARYGKVPEAKPCFVHCGRITLDDGRRRASSCANGNLANPAGGQISRPEPDDTPRPITAISNTTTSHD